MKPSVDLVLGDDGLRRCPWGLSTPDYVRYHDDEWGQPVRGDDRMFERLTLEAFQSGLSWITILRKRENFRSAFRGFSIEAVAEFSPADEARLMADAGIVRNRAKIAAAVQNARAALAVDGGLSELLWSFQPAARRAPKVLADIPAVTTDSTALARALKKRGFAFVGPTTAYALMQATGMVDDHLAGCHARHPTPQEGTPMVALSRFGSPHGNLRESRGERERRPATMGVPSCGGGLMG